MRNISLKAWSMNFLIGCLMSFTHSSQAAEKVDSTLLAAAKCSPNSESLSPSLAAYRLLVSAKVVVRERRGSVTTYAASMEPEQVVKLGNLTPTRLIVVEKDGYPNAMVGSMYSESYPLSDSDIVASFQGSLSRKIVLIPFLPPGFKSAGMSTGMISSQPVFKDVYMFAGKAGKERLILCGTKSDMESFGR